MKTIAIANLKGGVGKSTSAYWLASLLARAGRRPLLIDLDPQSDLTRLCNRHAGGSCFGDRGNAIGDTLTGRSGATANRTARHFSNFRLIQSDGRLEETAALLQGKSPNHLFLRSMLANGATEQLECDVAIIDCPPAAGILTVNAMCAADWLIVPVSPDGERLAINGLRVLQNQIDDLDRAGVPAPDRVGVVLTRYKGGQNAPICHRETFDRIQADPVPLLTVVPNREGVGAHDQIGAAYEPLAERVRAWLAQDETGDE